MIKRRLKCVVVAKVVVAIMKSTAQDSCNSNNSSPPFKKAYYGFGAGLDYGGFGFKAEFLPSKWIGVFGGVGYNLVDPAYNVGISIKTMPGKTVQPALMAMYGYNAVLNFKDNRNMSDSYYGVTIGAGGEVKYGTNSNKISFALLVPFRGSAFQNRYNALKAAGYKFSPDILPVAFSVGINFAINKLERSRCND